VAGNFCARTSALEADEEEMVMDDASTDFKRVVTTAEPKLPVAPVMRYGIFLIIVFELAILRDLRA